VVAASPADFGKLIADDEKWAKVIGAQHRRLRVVAQLRRGAEYLSALAMFLVERVSWRIKKVTSFASLFRGWLPQAGVAGMWRFTAAIST
jgi:hypothetical protein